MEVLLTRRMTVVFVGVLVAMVSLVWARAVAQEPTPYQVIGPDGSRPLPVARRSGSTDLVGLEVLPRFFNITMREDPRADGVVILAGTQRVVLTAGQATVSAGGRLVSLSAPVVKDGSRWLVPIDFLRVLDPVLNRRIEIRRESRLVIVDSAKVPRLTPRFERTPGGGRITVTADPPAQARVSRSGNLVTMRFEADALDVTGLSDAPADFVAGVKVAGTSLLLELGPAVVNVRQENETDNARVTLDLISPLAAAPTRSDAPIAPVAPTIERGGTIRTVVIDPGHGGSDAGTRNAAGLEEKDITLSAARILKGMIEAQLGLRTILTRDGDTDVAIDARTAIANNNKADLFISLHVNSSVVPAMRGWQLQSLDAADYGSLVPKEGSTSPTVQTVPVVGGGSRVIDVVPWQLAQIPHVRRSVSLAELLSARLAEAGLPPQVVPLQQTPARVLVGANMPAVLIELGFVSNAEDAAELGSRSYQVKLAEVITNIINGLRAGWPAAPDGGRP